MDSYQERQQRQLGLMSTQGLERLRGAGVAIAGLGMGGSIFINLVRLGIGRFHVADPDTFERSNINRQREAKEVTIGQRKDTALIAEARRINPEVQIEAFPDGVQPHNVAQFLTGMDFLVDVVDIYAMPAKLAVNQEAYRRGITTATMASLGYGCSLVVIAADGPSFAELSGMHPDLPPLQNLDRFGRFIAPGVPDYMQAQVTRAMRGEGHIPFVVSGVEAAGALCSAEVARHLLGMGGGVRAPRGVYLDPIAMRLETFTADWRARPSPVPMPATHEVAA
jgi:molybdopterin/thiamine biosynthesis adenylyltransferase